MQSSYERLTDAQWEFIKHFLDWKRKRELNLRDVFDAILYVTRTGIQWRNLKETNFPAWTAVYYYFKKWKYEGILEKINLSLNELERVKEEGRNSEPSLGLVNSQSIKLAPMNDKPRGIDGNKRVNGRKHILTDVKGRIYQVHVHAANPHDSPQGVHLLDLNEKYLTKMEKILADKTYRGTFAKAVEDTGITFEVPERPEGVKGFAVEAKRWVVERSFAWFNFYRRVVVDYEKTTKSAESFLFLANISIVVSSIRW